MPTATVVTVTPEGRVTISHINPRVPFDLAARGLLNADATAVMRVTDSVYMWTDGDDHTRDHNPYAEAYLRSRGNAHLRPHGPVLFAGPNYVDPGLDPWVRERLVAQLVQEVEDHNTRVAH